MLALMFQGTGSDVGKSLLVAGLGRAFTRRGLAVRPFKPQNMSNNAAVTVDGGEAGRAQALQARACGAPLTSDMNPVLLKPQSEVGAQVVVQGRVLGNAGARDYQRLKATLLPRVIESFGRVAADADLVLVEGAGSAAEVNLRAGDIANMGFATATGVPVVLIGDIHRGGVIASLCGTHQLIAPQERALVAGYLINKFRGDVSLFDSGVEAIARHTQMRCFGIVPWFADAARLPAEDAMAVAAPAQAAASATLRIAVPVLSRIANFDDLDPLAAELDVSVQFVPRGEALPGDADLVVLPGSKSTLADLAVLRAEGWDIDIAAHRRRGGLVVGLCGGYQMLGHGVADRGGVEGASGAMDGLGLLAMETSIGTRKTLTERSGIHVASGLSVHGFEMHMGETHGEALARPWLTLDGQPHGAVSADGTVMGGYLHGVFAADAFRHAFLQGIRNRQVAGVGYEAMLETTLDALAQHLEAAIDLDALLAAAGPITAPRPGPSRTRPVTATH